MLLTSFYLIFVLQDYNEYFRDLNVSNKKKMNSYINQGDCVQLNSIYPDMFRTEKNVPQGSVVLSNLK